MEEECHELGDSEKEKDLIGSEDGEIEEKKGMLKWMQDTIPVNYVKIPFLVIFWFVFNVKPSFVL